MPDPKPKRRGKGGKGKKGESSFDEWPDGQADQPSDEKPNAHRNGGRGANAVDAVMGERVDLTIDSCCAACALSVAVASAVGMQELNKTPRRAQCCKPREDSRASIRDPHTQIPEWRCAEF